MTRMGLVLTMMTVAFVVGSGTPRKRDQVLCGSGRDTVVVGPGGIDVVARDCKRVYVRAGQGDRLIRS